MKQLVIFIIILVTCCVCILAMSSVKTVKAPAGDTVTVFLTGSILGELQPCGCSSGQLGGIDRRKSIFDSVSFSKRLIVDTGSFVEKSDEQDLIKFNIEVEALSLLDYDVVNLTKEDIEISRELGLLEAIGSVLNVITSEQTEELKLPSKFTKLLVLKDKTISVSVAVFDFNSRPIEEVGTLFCPPSNLSTVNILILNHCDSEIIEYISNLGIVDCVVCPAESDQACSISEPDAKLLVISVGKHGKYIGKLQIELPEDGSKKLTYSSIAITPDMPQDEMLVELYKDYQELVKEANLLEKNLRLPLPDELKYIGSQACRICHEYEYDKWSSKEHAHAYASLEKVGSQYDPECVRCHVVGYDYEGGFISEKKTEHLKNVGCEICHGAGSKHIESAGAAKPFEPKLACDDCHTAERSKYLNDEKKYFEKIVHWREPNIADNVKKKENSKE